MLSSSCFKLSSGEVTLAINEPVGKNCHNKKRGKKRRKAAARPLFKAKFIQVLSRQLSRSPAMSFCSPPSSSVAARMILSNFAARSSSALMRAGSTAGGRGGGMA